MFRLSVPPNRGNGVMRCPCLPGARLLASQRWAGFQFRSSCAKRSGCVFLCPFWRRRRPKGGQRSLREISAELAQRGITNERGKPSLERRLTRCSTELRSRLSVAGVTYVTTNAPNFAVSFRDLFWLGEIQNDST